MQHTLLVNKASFETLKKQQSNGLFALPDTDSVTDSDLDSKPDGYMQNMFTLHGLVQ